MHPIEKNCLEIFPEILQMYGLQTLQKVSNFGLYIFFEDYFNEFLEKNRSDSKTLKKAAIFIEKLAQSDDQNIINLTEIGILEGLVNRNVNTIATHLGPHSKKLLRRATARTKIDKDVWRLTR